MDLHRGNDSQQLRTIVRLLTPRQGEGAISAIDQLTPLMYSQKTNERLNGGRRSRTRALHAMFTGCAVRDSEDVCASRHQDGSRQVR